jgi:hypothetical protein
VRALLVRAVERRVTTVEPGCGDYESQAWSFADAATAITAERCAGDRLIALLRR